MGVPTGVLSVCVVDLDLGDGTSKRCVTAGSSQRAIMFCCSSRWGAQVLKRDPHERRSRAPGGNRRLCRITELGARMPQALIEAHRRRNLFLSATIP